MFGDYDTKNAGHSKKRFSRQSVRWWMSSNPTLAFLYFTAKMRRDLRSLMPALSRHGNLSKRLFVTLVEYRLLDILENLSRTIPFAMVDIAMYVRATPQQVDVPQISRTAVHIVRIV